MSVKRCKFCGKVGSRMLELPGGYFTRPIPGHEEWACHDRAACGRRVAQIGQWVGKRVLRRKDLDGTEWVIRPAGSEWQLQMRYREHTMRAGPFETRTAAKAHVEELLTSFEIGKGQFPAYQTAGVPLR